MSTIAHLHPDCQEAKPRRLTDAEFWAVQNGNLTSPSEWDGWSLTDIYLFHRDQMSRAAAAAHVDSIMQNRMHFLRNELAVVVEVKLDVLEIPAYEWEPAYQYFDEV